MTSTTPHTASVGADSRRTDWVSHSRSRLLAWGLPIVALIVGALLEPPAKPAIWGASLTFMGAACLINAARGGRIHCSFTGPFFLLMALAALLHGFSIVPLGANGWLGLAGTIVVGGAVLTWLPEAVWGKFARRDVRPAEPSPGASRCGPAMRPLIATGPISKQAGSEIQP